LPAIGAFCEQGTAPGFSSLCSENVPHLVLGDKVSGTRRNEISSVQKDKIFLEPPKKYVLRWVLLTKSTHRHAI